MSSSCLQDTKLQFSVCYSLESFKGYNWVSVSPKLNNLITNYIIALKRQGHIIIAPSLSWSALEMYNCCRSEIDGVLIML